MKGKVVGFPSGYIKIWKSWNSFFLFFVYYQKLEGNAVCIP